MCEHKGKRDRQGCLFPPYPRILPTNSSPPTHTYRYPSKPPSSMEPSLKAPITKAWSTAKVEDHYYI